MTPFNPMRPFACRNGCVARLIGFAKSVDSGLAECLGRPLVVAVAVSIDGSETVFTYHSDGTLWGDSRESEFDLVNIEAKNTQSLFYMNEYYDGCGYRRTFHSSRKEADDYYMSKLNNLQRISCVKISYAPGQFDE